MEMKNNFDDILRQRWEERQFPIDPLHRSDMAKLLDTRKRRRVLPIWWFAGIGGIGVISVLLILWSRSTPERMQETASISLHGEETSEHRPAIDPGTAAKPIGMETNEILASDVKRDHVPASPSKDPGGLHGERSSLNGARLSTDHAKNESSHIAPLPSKQPKDQIGRKRQVERIPPDMAQALPVVANPDQPVFDAAKISASLEVGQAESQATLETISKATNEPISRSSAITGMLDPLELGGIEWQDVNSVGVIKPGFIHRKPLYLIAEAGGGLLFGSQPEYASGWKLRVGAGLGYDVSSRINLLWTTGYMMQDKGFDFERSSTVQQAGFGARSSFNTLTPERLHHIYSRLGMNYRIHRHLLHGYVGAQWLYGAQGRISIYVQDQFAGTNESSEYAWLNTNGLKRFRWTSGLSYGYQLTPRWMMMAGTDIQLSSLTNDDPALVAEGYYWRGGLATFHPFINFNYTLYGKR